MASNNDWKHELSHMLDVIEKQSTASLEKINRQFKALSLPFDENFRQDIVKMANFRFVTNPNQDFSVVNFFRYCSADIRLL